MRSYIKRFGIVFIFACLAFMGYFVWHVGPRAIAVYEALRDLRNLAHEVEGWPRPTQVARLQEDLHVLDTEVMALRRITRPLDPLLRHMKPIPRVGPVLATLPDLVEGGTYALHGVRLLVDAFVPAVPATRPNQIQDLFPPLLAHMRTVDNLLVEAETAFVRTDQALQRVNPGDLPSPMQHYVQRAQEAAYLAKHGIALLRLSPDLLGAEGEQRWLLVAQNNEELRPTGGFISAVGEVRVNKGQPGNLTFTDSYAFFSPRHTYPPAPLDMQEMLGVRLLLLRDANWWPDVPTSARVIARFYAMETGMRVDGVIFLDLEAVRLLVKGMGGLVLPDGTRIEANNLLPFMYEAWSRPPCAEEDACDWWKQRKEFLNLLGASMLKKIQTSPGSIPPLRFARYLVRALEAHHIIIVPLSNKRAQSLVAQYGWDAAMRPGTGDYLRITETNVGFNKANAKVKRTIAYEVNLQDPSSPAATLTMTYTHTAPGPRPRCFRTAYYGFRYEDMQNRCYWNYLRVAVPPGARLLERHGFQAGNVTTAVGDKGTTEFRGLVVVRPGERHTVFLRYALPPTFVRKNAYSLRIEKQPGMLPTPVTLTIVTERERYIRTLLLEKDVNLRVPLSPP